MEIKQVPAHTNNYGVGRSGKHPKRIILHWIVGTLSSADKTFQSPTRKASAHYGIEGNTIHQYVSEDDTAWHASNLSINRESIGIEHSGGDLVNGKRRKPSQQTHETSAKLVADICKRHNIPCTREFIEPHNKHSSTQCPGTLDIDLIIRMASDIINDMPQWLVQMYSERAIDITKPEGEVRGKVQEIFDKAKKYDENEKRIRQLEKNLEEITGEAAQYEASLQTARESVSRLEKELDKTKKQIVARDIDISNLEKQVSDLQKTIDPETKIIVDREEYNRLIKRKQLDRYTDSEIIKEWFRRKVELWKKRLGGDEK